MNKGFIGAMYSINNGTYVEINILFPWKRRAKNKLYPKIFPDHFPTIYLSKVWTQLNFDASKKE